ncbi:unnamed protein product [Symbiodinium sp. CCMP2456]|nr:unnamed protein product [Symbiodinium sp. CCMP2456]
MIAALSPSLNSPLPVPARHSDPPRSACSPRALVSVLLGGAAVPALASYRRSRPTALSAETRTEPPRCDAEAEVCEEIEEQRTERLADESELLEVSRVWSEGSWTADWGPGGPTWPSLVPERRSRRRRRPLQRSFSAADTLGLDALTLQTVWRVVLPTVGALFGGIAIYEPLCRWLQDMLDIGNTGRGPILQLLAMDQSQFMQNFLTVNGLLFTILCGNTYNSLYNQQEVLFHALFTEVSEAKSLLEQACLVCQGRPFYPKMLDSIGDYVSTDLRRLDVEPADLLANRPMDDPLEYILYATSVGVPSIIYDTIRDLRQARGQRLGAMQRKLPAIHFVLLYVLGILELMAFPLLGAGTYSMSPDEKILTIQALFFGAMSGAIVMTLQVIYELWKPFGGAYTVDTALEKMVQGLEEELRVRKRLWKPMNGEMWPPGEPERAPTQG